MTDTNRVQPGADSGADPLRWIQTKWLSNLGHDLGSPLFAARGYARMALEDREGNLTESQRRYLTIVVENINRAASLVRQLKEFPTAGDLEVQTLDLSALLETAIRATANPAREKKVELSHDIAKGLISIGDRAKLADAMQAFLSAAVEFTEPEGKVALQALGKDENISVRVCGSSGSARLDNVEEACKILRLHGGSASLGTDGESGFALQIDLPNASESEMQ